jgi:hypothetical protein
MSSQQKAYHLEIVSPAGFAGNCDTWAAPEKMFLKRVMQIIMGSGGCERRIGQ